MQNTEPEKKQLQHRLFETNAIIFTGVILVAIGISASFFFSDIIEKFFWEVRTRSVSEVVHELNTHYLQKYDIESWQAKDSKNRIETFAKETREYIPNTVALKIYTTGGILAWTDLRNVKPGYQKPTNDGELKKVAENKNLTLVAGDATKQELGKQSLLEVWSTIETNEGEALGYVEIYFDTSDVDMFIAKIQYAVWGGTIMALGIIIILLRLYFRKQDEVIVNQARELLNIIEKSPVGIYTIDEKGVILSMNPKMLEFINRKTSEGIIGKNVFDMEYVQKANSETDIRKALIGRPFEKEVHITQDDGTELYQHCNGTPIFAEDDKTVKQILFTIEDITEQRKLEKEASLQHEKLKEAVDNRTKELRGKIDELEQFQRLTVNREVRMTELKQEIESMRIKLETLGEKGSG